MNHLSAGRTAQGLLVIVMLAACADKDAGNTSAQTNQTSLTDDSGGDPTGDPSAGSATDTGGTGSQGECDDYLACIGAVSPDKLDAAEMAYGPGSQCWQSGPELMQGCLDACAAGLSALGQVYPDEPKCQGAGGTTTDDPTGGVMTEPTTDPTTISTTDPTTVTGTGDLTTGEPETTDPSTTNDTQTSDTQTSDSTTSDTTTGGDGYGNCGWNAGSGWYGCDGVPGLEDPDGITPIACPGNPKEGDPCQEGGPISGVGCCMPNGDNFYCAGLEIILESCGG